ncbi:MAG: hypothetical protein ACI8QF_001738, partial [Limisphaerales bacterium]
RGIRGNAYDVKTVMINFIAHQGHLVASAEQQQKSAGARSANQAGEVRVFH